MKQNVLGEHLQYPNRLEITVSSTSEYWMLLTYFTTGMLRNASFNLKVFHQKSTLSWIMGKKGKYKLGI